MCARCYKTFFLPRHRSLTFIENRSPLSLVKQEFDAFLHLSHEKTRNAEELEGCIDGGFTKNPLAGKGRDWNPRPPDPRLHVTPVPYLR